MTLGTLTLAPPSPPFACTVDLLFREPFIRLAGNVISHVQNRSDESWHVSPSGAPTLRLIDGVARGPLAAAFPTLSPLYASPAGAVTPVGDHSRAAVTDYFAAIRREVSSG